MDVDMTGVERGRKGRRGRRLHRELTTKIEAYAVLISPPPLPSLSLYSLSQEVHGLMRVMWSGKWAVVTPHAVLNAVWRLVPAFRGYSQQDAQEFLW